MELAEKVRNFLGAATYGEDLVNRPGVTRWGAESLLGGRSWVSIPTSDHFRPVLFFEPGKPRQVQALGRAMSTSALHAQVRFGRRGRRGRPGCAGFVGVGKSGRSFPRPKRSVWCSGYQDLP